MRNIRRHCTVMLYCLMLLLLQHSTSKCVWTIANKSMYMIFNTYDSSQLLKQQHKHLRTLQYIRSSLTWRVKRSRWFVVFFMYIHQYMHTYLCLRLCRTHVSTFSTTSSLCHHSFSLSFVLTCTLSFVGRTLHLLTWARQLIRFNAYTCHREYGRSQKPVEYCEHSSSTVDICCEDY